MAAKLMKLFVRHYGQVERIYWSRAILPVLDALLDQEHKNITTVTITYGTKEDGTKVRKFLYWEFYRAASKFMAEDGKKRPKEIIAPYWKVKEDYRPTEAQVAQAKKTRASLEANGNGYPSFVEHLLALLAKNA